MLKVAVLVSGGGTNLQAIIDGIENGSITNAKIDVVISNNKNAYALERAKKHDIEAVALSPKDFETRDWLILVFFISFCCQYGSLCVNIWFCIEHFLTKCLHAFC